MRDDVTVEEGAENHALGAGLPSEVGILKQKAIIDFAISIFETFAYHNDGDVPLRPGLVRRHCHDGDAEVDPQHVDDAEAEEGQGGHHVAALQGTLAPTAILYEPLKLFNNEL